MKYEPWFSVGVSIVLFSSVLSARLVNLLEILMNWPTKLQQKMTMSDWSNLTLYLEKSLTGAVGSFLEEWTHNVTAVSKAKKEDVRNILCYLVVMLGMLAFIMVAMLVSTVKSKRREHSNDPYHQYIKEDWTAQIQQSEIISNYAAK